MTERLYDLSLNGGADEEASEGDGGAWAGLMRMRRAGVIIWQDSQGFITSEVVPLADVESRWGEVSEAMEPADCGGGQSFDD